MRRSLVLTCGAVVLLLVAGVLHADIIKLNTGGQVEGRIIEETADYLRVKTFTGETIVPIDDIEQIVRKKTDWEIYEEKEAQIAKSDDAKKHYELGVWCKEHNLTALAEKQFLRAIELDPKHEETIGELVELGLEKHKGKWLSVREFYNVKVKELGEGDAEASYKLALWCKNTRLKREAKKLLRQAIKLDPNHRGAREALGYKLHKGKWLTRREYEKVKISEAERKRLAEIEELKGKYLKEEDVAGRRRLHAELKKRRFSKSFEYCEKVYKWSKAPKGLIKDKPLELKKDKYPGKYTICVPENYNPWNAYPFIVFLHGGGPGVGDGKHYLYWWYPEATNRGYIMVLPTVLKKVSCAWNDPTEEKYVLTVIEEMKRNYHIDVARIYCCGHSMGGGGCWYIGTRNAHIFAAINPNSGFLGHGTRLENLHSTPTYIIHGNKDPKVSVENSRRAAKRLKALGYEYIYRELDIPGHGVPLEERNKVLDWLADKRLKKVRSRRKAG
jgi:pimeloyl-ACP methyl ester carboxylesterase